MLSIAAVLFAVLASAGSARAGVVARVNLAAQEMTVSVDGFVRYVWPVSTARRGYRTPVGSYHPVRLERTWYSRKYHNSPMPYAIFFLGGYAVHGTNETSAIGMPVSHGCVRLHTENARTLFRLVKEYGRGNSRIVVARGGPSDRRGPAGDRDYRPRRFFLFPFLMPES
jgi:lipoprotein-anchoring transpeptidase ErfK/SrfK